MCSVLQSQILNWIFDFHSIEHFSFPLSPYYSYLYTYDHIFIQINSEQIKKGILFLFYFFFGTITNTSKCFAVCLLRKLLFTLIQAKLAGHPS